MNKDMENTFNLMAELGGSEERLGNNTGPVINAPLIERKTRPTPVAPVSPDATGKCGELYSYEYGFPSMHKVDRGGDWCQRAQAEELLAAERAGYEEVLADKRRLTRLLDVAMHGEDGAAKQASLCDLIEPAKRMRADNAALTARVKELEQINAVLMGDDEDKPRYTTKRLKLEITRATEALEVKLAAAEKALEDVQKYVWDQRVKLLTVDPNYTVKHQIFKDIGKKIREARAALGGKPS